MKPYARPSRSQPRKPPRWRKPLLWSLAGLAAAAVLGVVTFIVVFFRADQPVEALAARWGQPPSGFVQVGGEGGARVHVRDLGPRDDPTPLLLIHGSACGLHTWSAWAGALAQQRRVVMLDLPGFGLTGPLADGQYGVARQVRFLTEVMDVLGLRRVIVVGHGLGGELAWQLAYAHPDRVTRMALIAAQGYPTQPWQVPLEQRVMDTPPLSWLGRITRPRWLVERSLAQQFANPQRITPEQVDCHLELPLREGNRRAQLQRLAQNRFHAQSERIRTLTLPTLILWGEQDRQAPSEQARWFERDIRGARAVILPGVGHLPQEEAPEGALAELQQFLGGQAP